MGARSPPAAALLVASQRLQRSDDSERPTRSPWASLRPVPPARNPATSGETITLVTYDSFPESDTSLNDALASFTAQTGIGVEILVAGDAGTMLSKASLTAGNPEGDVMWGIDNTLLSRAVADDVFDPYVAAGIADGSVTIDDDVHLARPQR